MSEWMKYLEREKAAKRQRMAKNKPRPYRGDRVKMVMVETSGGTMVVPKKVKHTKNHPQRYYQAIRKARRKRKAAARLLEAQKAETISSCSQSHGAAHGATEPSAGTVGGALITNTASDPALAL